MEHKNEELKQYLLPGKHVHLVGIGGVSMRPLGLVLQGMGIHVTGSDMNSSVSTDELIAKGIHVHIGHSEDNIVGADCIIRTAAAAGYNQVYLTEDCADAYSQKAVRASMSGVFRVKVMRGKTQDLFPLISAKKVVADMDGQDVFSVKPDGDVCLIIGNEGHGVSSLVRENSSFTVKIPMENGVESLNAAVSAGILMYCLK